MPFDFFSDGNNVTLSRIMCNKRNLDKIESIEIGCTNYCNTTDEECNQDDIADATCLDVGCGDGKPSCTDKCRLNYTTCASAQDEVPFKLNIETAANGWQTIWEIRNSEGIEWQSETVYSNFDDGITEFRCLKRSCHIFELKNFDGDGLCCEKIVEDFGTFSLSNDGKEVRTDILNSNSSIIHEVGFCDSVSPTLAPSQFPSETPSFSPSITSSPSAIPSQMPSEEPTLIPSQFPSELPSSSPSGFPTKNPSLFPTISVHPSLLPSLRPSSYPSYFPSFIPSSFPSLLPTSTSKPSRLPSKNPSRNPSPGPSLKVSQNPSATPSLKESAGPSLNPSPGPSLKVSQNPSAIPSLEESAVPSLNPSPGPSLKVSQNPSATPSLEESAVPSLNPSPGPSLKVSQNPSATPSLKESAVPSLNPSQNVLPVYDPLSYDSQCRSLGFRVANNVWNGKESSFDRIEVSGGGWNKIHAEFTSRILNDGEFFTVIGSKKQVGVGLCIDSCSMESGVGIRFNYNCAGFYGDGTNFMAADIYNTEYTTTVDRVTSTIQGFKYDRLNNCVIHVGSLSQTCTSLPSHFNGAPVRAIAQVWNSANAFIASNRRLQLAYDTQSWNSQCNSMKFRTATSSWNGRWSKPSQIGIQGKAEDKKHVELSSRRLNDNELFRIQGSSEHVGVGLCIDSCSLESSFGIRGDYNCVGFLGNDIKMWSTDTNGNETWVNQVNTPNNDQGFTYNQSGNCITHIDSINGSCASLPSHFNNQPVRAIVQVWNNSFANLTS